MPPKCIVCGKPTSMTNKSEYCSAACKQKRHRDKKEAGKRAALIGQGIDALTDTYSMGAIARPDAVAYHNLLWSKLNRLTDKINEDIRKDSDQIE